MKIKIRFTSLFLYTVLLSIAASFINGKLYKETNSMSLIALSSQIILITPSVVYFISNKKNPLKLLRFNKISFSSVVLLILFTFLLTPVMTFINALSLLIFKNETVNSILSVVDESGLLLSLLLIAIIPSIFEELVYRGVFYMGYQKVLDSFDEVDRPISMKRIRYSIILSAILFAIIHMNGNQFSYALVMGIVFALVIEATNSLFSTMIIHFLINGTSIIISYMAPKLIEMLHRFSSSENADMDKIQESLTVLPENFSLPMVAMSYGPAAIISAVLAIIVFRTIAKNHNRWEHIVDIFTKKDSDIGEKKSIKEILPLIIGIIICVVIMILNEIL